MVNGADRPIPAVRNGAAQPLLPEVQPGAGCTYCSTTWASGNQGAAIGLALYVASRLFAPAEEADLAARFGPEWDAYRHRVKVPWL